MQQLITHLPPQTTYELLDQLQAPAFKQLACFGNQLLTICLFHQGKLSGNKYVRIHLDHCDFSHQVTFESSFVTYLLYGFNFLGDNAELKRLIKFNFSWLSNGPVSDYGY